MPFSGILVDTFKVSDLSGWTMHYEKDYAQGTTALDLDSIPLSANWVLIGARHNESDVLQLCAVGRRDEVLKRTKMIEPHEHNDVWWYFTDGVSFGFAPDGVIKQQQADTHNHRDNKRLSWHLGGSSGGYRAGNEKSSSSFVKCLWVKGAATGDAMSDGGPFVWSADQKSGKLEVQDGGTKLVCKDGSGYSAGVGNVVMSAGRHQWDFKMSGSSCSYTRFGVAQDGGISNFNSGWTSSGNGDKWLVYYGDEDRAIDHLTVQPTQGSNAW